MKGRIIKDTILYSFRVNALSCKAEAFFLRLLDKADDGGNHSAKLSVLREELYPLKLDEVDDVYVEACLDELESCRLIRRYEVDGFAFLRVEDFRHWVETVDNGEPEEEVSHG